MPIEDAGGDHPHDALGHSRIRQRADDHTLATILEVLEPAIAPRSSPAAVKEDGQPQLVDLREDGLGLRPIRDVTPRIHEDGTEAAPRHSYDLRCRSRGVLPGDGDRAEE